MEIEERKIWLKLLKWENEHNIGTQMKGQIIHFVIWYFSVGQSAFDKLTRRIIFGSNSMMTTWMTEG